MTGLERDTAKGTGPSRHLSSSRTLNSDLVAKGVQFKGGMLSEAVGSSSDADPCSSLLSTYPMPGLGTGSPKVSFFISR